MMNRWVVIFDMSIPLVFPWLILGKFIGMKVNQWLNKSSFFFEFHWLISEWWWRWWSNGWNGAPYFQTRWSLKHQWMIWVDLFFVFPEMFVCQNTNGLWKHVYQSLLHEFLWKKPSFLRKKTACSTEFNGEFTTPLVNQTWQRNIHYVFFSVPCLITRG